MKTQKNHLLYYFFLVVFFAAYVYFSVTAPQPKVNPFKIDPSQLIWIQISFYVPTFFIWLCALFASLHLTAYAKVVRGTKDGEGMYPLSVGVNLMIAYLFLSSALNLFMTYSRVLNPSIVPMLTITNSLTNVFTYLVALLLIYTGSKKLLQIYPDTKLNQVFLGVAVALLGVMMYLYLDTLFTNATRTDSSNPLVTPTYYLKDSLIVLLIAIPSFVTWFLTILTIANLRALMARSTGIIYKKGIGLMGWGLLGIILGTVITQGFGTLGSQRLLNLGLQGILIIIYILVFVIALGYLFIALGTKKLTQIEVG